MSPVVSTAPTLLRDNEIASPSNADPESVKQGMGCASSPRPPQALAWSWAHAVINKNPRNEWKQGLLCPG